jgi:DNA-binding MarR family transcriptional regulator
MQGTHDISQKADDSDELDPREAARLLAQTEREARRQFNLNPQWINGLMAAVILVAYGTLWLSTRGQHPYKGPNLGVVALVYVAVAVAFAVSVKVYRRATAGVSGPAMRQQQVEGVAILIPTRQPRTPGRAQARWRQPRDRLRLDPSRGSADHRRHDRPRHRRQQGRLAAVRGRTRSRAHRRCGRVRRAERSVAGSRDRPVHRARRLHRSRHLAASPRATAGMTADSLDPVIHAPARLRIVATLAALPDGASLSFTRLQDMLELTPGNLITHLRKLQDAGYLNSETNGNGRASRTSIALTRQGRAALHTYTTTLRDLLDGL